MDDIERHAGIIMELLHEKDFIPKAHEPGMRDCIERGLRKISNEGYTNARARMAVLDTPRPDRRGYRVLSVIWRWAGYIGFWSLSLYGWFVIYRTWKGLP